MENSNQRNIIRRYHEVFEKYSELQKGLQISLQMNKVGTSGLIKIYKNIKLGVSEIIQHQLGYEQYPELEGAERLNFFELIAGFEEIRRLVKEALHKYELSNMSSSSSSVSEAGLYTIPENRGESKMKNKQSKVNMEAASGIDQFLPNVETAELIKTHDNLRKLRENRANLEEQNKDPILKTDVNEIFSVPSTSKDPMAMHRALSNLAEFSSENKEYSIKRFLQDVDSITKLWCLSEAEAILIISLRLSGKARILADRERWFEKDTKITLTEIKQLLLDHFMKKASTADRLQKLISLKQEQDEPILTYASRAKSISLKVYDELGYKSNQISAPKIQESLIRNFVRGLLPHIRTHLLITEGITFDQVVVSAYKVEKVHLDSAQVVVTSNKVAQESDSAEQFKKEIKEMRLKLEKLKLNIEMQKQQEYAELLGKIAELRELVDKRQDSLEVNAVDGIGPGCMDFEEDCFCDEGSVNGFSRYEEQQ